MFSPENAARGGDTAGHPKCVRSVDGRDVHGRAALQTPPSPHVMAVELQRRRILVMHVTTEEEIRRCLP